VQAHLAEIREDAQQTLQETRLLIYELRPPILEELVQAIRQVHQGEPSLHPTIAQKLLTEIAQPVERPSITDPLTEREIEVLKLLAHGLSNQEIADKLVIGVTTVYTHVSNILAKLHLATRTQAALYALREGYVPLYEQDE
jgi:NarL family two-component system response regulator LiaR